MKKIVLGLLSKINVHPDKNQQWLLMSTVVSGLLITYVHPTLVKEIVSNLPAQWLAFESLSYSVTGLLIGVVWQKKTRKRAINYFFYLASTESVCGFLLGMYLCFVEWNVWIFAIASLIYSAVVSSFVSKCIMAFKSKLWVEKDREVFDNNASIMTGIVCIVGYIMAIVASPSLTVSVFIWAICCIVDDIGWLIVYKKNKEKLQEEN